MSPCDYGAVSLGSPEIHGFRPSFRGNEPMPDQSVSDVEENEWADLSGASVRRRFSEPQLSRRDGYDGPLRHLSEEDARRGLTELLQYFLVEGFEGMPLPPAGLPGTISKKVEIDAPEWGLLAIGYDYFLCAARSQSRAMHNRWDAATAFIRSLEERAREEALRSRWQMGERPEREQLVYFIASESGPIKIGCAVRPEGRCKELQTSHHEKLTVLVTCPGGQPQERAYHARFAAHRLHGEWFERHPDILAEIERINQETPHAR